MRLLSIALLALIATTPLFDAAPAAAQSEVSAQSRAALCRNPAYRRANPRTCARLAPAKKKEQPAPQQKAAEPPGRPDFTAADQAAAIIPNIADARFWADSEKDFIAALPTERGPWINLSTGGGDGAFGAGLFNGWSESGKRPTFSLVTGVSTGALMAPFVFVGSTMDGNLKRYYTEYNAGDIFEDVKTPESLVDTWPLKRVIAKEVTPELLAAIAERHKQGRRLFIATTNLDASRGMVWNMGAIAARGDEAALKLFRDILLASTAIPGLFPPVMIDVEVNGRKTQEMHADGGLAAQVYTAPETLLDSTSTYKLPATELYVVANTGLTPEFQTSERSLLGVLGRSISVGVRVLLRLGIDRAAAAARRSDIPFYLAYPALAHSTQEARGVFDSEYMKSLFDLGVARGKTGTPFVTDVAEALNPPPAK